MPDPRTVSVSCQQILHPSKHTSRRFLELVTPGDESLELDFLSCDGACSCASIVPSVCPKDHKIKTGSTHTLLWLFRNARNRALWLWAADMDHVWGFAIYPRGCLRRSEQSLLRPQQLQHFLCFHCDADIDMVAQIQGYDHAYNTAGSQ